MLFYSDDLINENSELNYNFLLPTSNQLCDTLNSEGPQYIITSNNDFSFNCLREVSSKYKLLSTTEKLNNNDIFIFKKFKHWELHVYVYSYKISLNLHSYLLAYLIKSSPIILEISTGAQAAETSAIAPFTPS